MVDQSNARKLSMILTAQIVHELKALPRGTVSADTIAFFEVAYKMASALEDVLRAAYSSNQQGVE